MHHVSTGPASCGVGSCLLTRWAGGLCRDCGFGSEAVSAMTSDQVYMATLGEVARMSGVSTSTVSRYLRGQLDLSEGTERRVRQAVDALGYVVNARASSLAKRRSGLVGLVLPGLSNPFFAALADHVADEVARRDLSLLLCTTRDIRHREEEYTNLLEGQAVDGMLYLGAHPSNKRLAAAIKSGLAVVVIDETQKRLPPVSTLTVDNFTGGFQATSHLIESGHRQIGYIGGPKDLPTEIERKRGYTEALTMAGISLESQVVVSGPYTEQFGISALPYIVTHTHQVTAAFCASDHTALGVISAAHTHGIKIPEQLSIVGFDDVAVAKYITPRLTTVRQPVSAIAKNAVEMLIDRINHPSAPPELRTLPVELVIRDSVVRPPAAVRRARRTSAPTAATSKPVSRVDRSEAEES